MAKIKWEIIRLFIAVLGIYLCCTPLVYGRETGWVPMESPGKDFSLKGATSSQSVKNRDNSRQSARTGRQARTASVYEDQPPVTEKEVKAFVEVLPIFRSWARKNGEKAHPVVNSEGKPDFLYSPKAAKWVEEHNFPASRFFCIMGRMAAGLVIVEEGNDLSGTRPPDMPSVSPQELGLVRKHLNSLLAAGGPAQPIK